MSPTVMSNTHLPTKSLIKGRQQTSPCRDYGVQVINEGRSSVTMHSGVTTGHPDIQQVVHYPIGTPHIVSKALGRSTLSYSHLTQPPELQKQVYNSSYPHLGKPG
jgi:hypothetical protein